MKPSIRIPTPDAPASHHLTFICAVAELTHRVLESVTGLTISLHIGVHSHMNTSRQPALLSAAADAGLCYDEYDGANWYSWEPNGPNSARVTIYGDHKFAAAPTVTVEPESNVELRQAVL